MKEIIIKSKKHGTKQVLVSDIDYPHLIKYKWWLKDTKGKYPYACTRGLDPQYPGRTIKMHRILLGATSRFQYVDHTDKNTLNNQSGNLRLVTPSQNAMNRHCRNENPTKLKGVSFRPDRIHGYSVYISISGKKIYGGCFSSAEEAANKYNELARQYHGEFASLNFPK